MSAHSNRVLLRCLAFTGLSLIALAPAYAQTAQSISFAALSGIPYSTGSFALTATASSGLPVAYTSNSLAVCTVSAGFVTLVNGGTCSITASQAGNGTYAAATPVTQTFAVTGAPQSIIFDSIPTQLFGASPFAASAVASSGLAVTFTSFNPTVCRTAGGVITLLGAGSCEITANQSGNTYFSAAPPATVGFVVNQAIASNQYTGATGNPFATGSGPSATAIGDFNRDGFPDFAVANATGGTVTVWLSDGHGGFTAAGGNPFSVGAGPASIVVADFNGDKFLDIATANASGNNVTVLLGNGSGGFAAAAASPFAAGTSPAGIAVGDFNTDGIPDLVIANNGSNNVTVLLGDGAGGFTAMSGSPFAAGTAPSSVAVADFNADGIPDLAIANSSTNAVTVLLGGSGTFTFDSGGPFRVGTHPASLVVGDFNADGLLDIATANSGSSDVSVLLGDGVGGFSAAKINSSAVGTGGGALVAGDFNGDGITDLAVANSGSGNVALLLGGGSGIFNAVTTPLTVGTTPDAVAVGDFNNDGVADLLIANGGAGNASLLLGTAATSQTINFLPVFPLSNPQLGIPPSSLFATASSGLPVTFTSATPSVCTASSTLLTAIATGVCEIVATQAGNATYGAAAAIQVYTIAAAGSTTPPPSTGGLSLTITRNPEIALGSNIETTLAVTGGVPPYTWFASGLPSGVSINTQTGVLTGVPAAAGNYTFTVRAADSEGVPLGGSIPVTIQVLGFTSTATLPAGATTSAYATTFTAGGGSGTYTFTIPHPPAGLTLSGAVLSGTPTTVGSFTFLAEVTDSSGVVAASAFTLNVTGPSTPLIVSGGTLPSGSVGTAYLQGLPATGGVPPYTWSITSGTLPSGLTLNASTGLVSGTPTAVRTSTFTAQVVDTANNKASGIFTLAVTGQSLTITGLPFATGIAGSVYPAQVLTGSGGAAPYTFAITAGALPAGVALTNGQLSGTPATAGTYNFSITMTDSESPAQTVTTASQIVIAPASSTSLITSVGSISFNLAVGASAVPSPAVIAVEATSAQQQVTYSTAVTPSVTWLDVSPVGGTTPARVTVALDPTALNLAASSTPLTTSVVISCFAGNLCAGQSITIPVTLTITAPPPQLSFSQNLVSFTVPVASATAVSQTVPLTNVGGGSASITSITAADSWLTIPNPPTTIPAGQPVKLTFVANPSTLSTGYHTTTVTVQSSAGTLTIPVTVEVAPLPVLTLGTSGEQFQSTVGNSPANIGGSVQIGALGSGTVSWTATVLPGASWLTLSGAASGTAISGSPATLNYSIAASRIAAAGTYYGTIQVTAPGVPDSPLNYLVVLNVAPSGTAPVPVLQPTGLVFTYVLGSALMPDSQTIDIGSNSGIATPFTATLSTNNAGTWLSIDSSTGLSSANPTQSYSTISVTPGALAVGTYTGTITYQFSAASVQTVNVTLVVAPVPAPPFGCSPTKLIPTFTGLANNFSLTAAWPDPVSVTVVDDCGNSVQNATVTATFSNNDSPIALSLASAGVFAGTWTPTNTSAQATVTVTATSPSATIGSGTATVTGTVLPGSAPQLTPGGTLHIYNEQVGNAIPPGTILEIYGSNLSPSPVLASTIPLPQNLGGTSVTIGGYPAPLYYVSASQIDAELPTELTPGNSYQVVVTSGTAESMPQTVQITAALPAVATLSNGLAIAQHNDGSAVTESSPAKPGEPLSLYAIGLGATNNPVADGAAAVANPLSSVTATTTVLVNGESVTPTFAGLSPGYVALYQINFKVPADAANGDLTLVISQNGVTSNSAVLPVHN